LIIPERLVIIKKHGKNTKASIFLESQRQTGGGGFDNQTICKNKFIGRGNED